MTTDVPVDQRELFSGDSADASQRLLRAAVQCFSLHGYHGTTTREIADLAKMSPAGMYVHYKAKADLLYEVSQVGHASVLAVVKEALLQGGSATERTRRYVEAFAAWHATNHDVARIIQYELRSLPPEQFSSIAKMRQQFQRLMEQQLRSGSRSGEFQITSPSQTARAILSLCIDIARWYQPGKHQTPATLGAFYGSLVLRMVTATDD
jgi:AcrR family transcriptional regulator